MIKSKKYLPAATSARPQPTRRASRIVGVDLIPPRRHAPGQDDEARLLEFTAELGRLSARRRAANQSQAPDGQL
jgi:hypothetical protein